MSEVLFFFRKMTPGAFSINQTFAALAVEIGKYRDVRSHHLKKNGASLKTILSNILEARRTAVAGINHITGDVHYLIFGIHRGHTVLTIHDCILLARTPRRNPKYYLYLWLWYKLPVWKADVVTTISEKARSEIVACTGCNPDKIKVVPNFVHEAYRHHVKDFNKTRPRILHIGLFLNKNMERVVAALEGIPCIFEIIGELEDHHRELLDRHRIDFENHANHPIEVMAARYRLADLLVFASTYEGFGLPIVEAQATGTPVVTSNLEPMTWVAGDHGACFVDPFDTGSIRSGILRVMEEDGFREKLIQNGLENVRRFTLKEVARQYMDIYESLTNSSCAA